MNDGPENCDCWKSGALCADCIEHEAVLRRRIEARIADGSMQREIREMFDAFATMAEKDNGF